MLKYNEGIYQGKIDQLTEYISMLNGHIEKLTTYKDQLKMFWDDVDGMNLSKALQAALTSTNNQLFYLQKQLSFYKKMVAEYSRASADVRCAFQTEAPGCSGRKSRSKNVLHFLKG